MTYVNESVWSKKKEELSTAPATVQFATRNECFAFEDHKHLYTKPIKKSTNCQVAKEKFLLNSHQEGITRRVHVLWSRSQISEKTTLFSALLFFFIFFLLGLGARSGITNSLKQNYLLE